MNILVTICARGGSKGVPGKNIKLIDGLPLIAYSIKAAQEFAQRYSADMILSTEDEGIREEAAQYGLSTDYRRPMVLAGDAIGKADVIRDVFYYAEKINNKKYDLVLDLDVTSPLRTQEDLDKGLKAFLKNKEALALFSVNHSHRNPYFNMVEDAGNNMVRICKKLDDHVLARQYAPPVYDINGSFYYYRRAYFDEGITYVVQDNRCMVYVMDHVCFDVDTQFDYKMLKYLIEEGQLEFFTAEAQRREGGRKDQPD